MLNEQLDAKKPTLLSDDHDDQADDDYDYADYEESKQVDDEYDDNFEDSHAKSKTINALMELGRK